MAEAPEPPGPTDIDWSFDIPSPYWTAPTGHRLVAVLMWMVVLLGAYSCSANLVRLLQLPARPLQRFLEAPLAVAILIAVSATLWVMWRRVDMGHWTKWWDPAVRPDGPISWNHVRGLVRDDPLNHVPLLRPIYFLGRMPIYVLNLTVIAVLTWFVICLVERPWLPDMLKPDTEGGKVFQQLIKPNLTAYLALVAAAASIFFAYMQLRAKVRADNRQAWIDRARAHLATVTSLGSDHADASRTEAPKLWREFAPLRVELELMLNSSEQDHRLLAFLLHELAVVRFEKGATIEDTENLKHLIELDSGLAFDEWLPNSGERRHLITYILRLSHVVLKREWERVKHTR